MIVVTGEVTARPETFDELKRVSLEHVHRSLAEPGCLHHSVQVSCEDPLKLVFVERWADKAALKAHFLVPASGAFMREARKLAASAPPIAIYDTVEMSVEDILA